MKVLVTGGAGFIGSNLADSLINHPKVSGLKILDNYSTGNPKNVEHILVHPKVEIIEGDIRNGQLLLDITKDVDLISHQAALGSVPRSIKDPVTTNDVNIGGTLNVFEAARKNGIKRVVFASSSSVYGDQPDLPKEEHKIGQVLSPYAFTKLANENYASLFSKLYEFEFIGFRYFNIFGKRQDPNGAYAAVIPKFFASILSSSPPTINGDGTFSRDFTFVDNAVQANINGLFTEHPDAVNQFYNVACGKRVSLNELWQIIQSLAGKKLEAIYGPERPGDVPHSLANIKKAENLLSYQPETNFKESLEKAFFWYRQNFNHGKSE